MRTLGQISVLLMGTPVLLLCQVDSVQSGQPSPDSLCTIVVNSEPDNAAVYVGSAPGDIFKGQTPLTITGLRPGWTELKVVKRDFVLWKGKVSLTPGEQQAVTARLTPSFGMLTLEMSSDSLDVLIDGSILSHGAIRDRKIPTGQYTLEARTATGDAAAAKKIYVQAGTSLRLGAYLDQPTLRPLALSAVVPGLGQATEGSYVKGALLFIGFVSAGIVASNANSAYGSKASELRALHDGYLITRSPASAMAMGTNLDAKQQEVNKAYRVRSATYVIVGGIYALSLVDVFLHHLRTSEIRQLAEIPPAARFVSLPGGGPGIRFSFTMPFEGRPQ